MCHLLCLAVMLYSELPPAEIWANKLCWWMCMVGYKVFEHKGGERPRIYRCIHRDYLPSASCVKKIQATSNQCFQPCY
ncbi:unnamed protein product [Sphagnum jensenii]|uniref:Secreted protein n=1 Tax=Sphagnum jensenii TaxID=128206 RepID=A0ABP0XG39_9BRYO